jgi:Xaa-Pro aminopeptidase
LLVALTVYSERRNRLLKLAKGKQVIAATGPNMFYLTDFFGAGVAVVHHDRTIVVTSPLEADRAEEMCKEAEVTVVKKWKDAGKTVAKMLAKGEVVSDSDELRFVSKRFAVEPDLFLEARRIKDEKEVERIKTACQKTNKVFEELPGMLRQGRSEWEVAAEVMRLATEQGLVPSNSTSSLGPIIIASGPHGAYGHSELTDRRLRSGEFVVADLFFRFEGYNSDETRTFAVGSASAEMKRHYAAVKEANEAALKAAKAGVTCGDVNDAAVGVLRRYGMEGLLTHGVGHGVGLDIHELPRIARGNAARLQNNDVITDEPGVYRAGRFGVRIEDTMVVRGERPIILTRFTRDLVTCGP